MLKKIFHKNAGHKAKLNELAHGQCPVSSLILWPQFLAKDADFMVWKRRKIITIHHEEMFPLQKLPH